MVYFFLEFRLAEDMRFQLSIGLEEIMTKLPLLHSHWNSSTKRDFRFHNQKEFSNLKKDKICI